MAERFATVQQVREYAGITDATDDALLDRLILSASSVIKARLSRNLLTATYNEVRDGTGTASLFVRNAPITAVSMVRINGREISPRGAVNSLGYTFSEHCVRLSGGLVFERGHSNIEIDYTAGYDELPEAIRQACIEVVVLRYKARDRQGLRAKTLGGEVISFTGDDFPDFVNQTIENFKSVSLA